MQAQANHSGERTRHTLVTSLFRWLPITLVRFIAVGILNTCVGLGTVYLGMYALHLSDIRANLLGYIIGVMFSYTLNRNWTFRVSTGIPRAALGQFFRFILVIACAYAANLVTVLTLVEAFHCNRYIAQACGTIPYTILGYLGSRYFAFPAGARDAADKRRNIEP